MLVEPSPERPALAWPRGKAALIIQVAPFGLHDVNVGCSC